MKVILLCLTVVLISCKTKTNRSHRANELSAPAGEKPVRYEYYSQTKINVAKLARKQSTVNKQSNAFISVVCDSIVPYWLGTKWDYNGFTETPQQGNIACGYFVTTVLRDAGVQLNRVSLAQCASEEMIRKLVDKKYIRRYSSIPQSGFINVIRNNGKGLYIIGLDNHTGFIEYADDGIWFIHSSFVSPGTVAKQDAVNNAILSHSKYRVTGKLSADEQFLKRWKENNTAPR